MYVVVYLSVLQYLGQGMGDITVLLYIPWPQLWGVINAKNKHSYLTLQWRLSLNYMFYTNRNTIFQLHYILHSNTYVTPLDSTLYTPITTLSQTPLRNLRHFC